MVCFAIAIGHDQVNPISAGLDTGVHGSAKALIPSAELFERLFTGDEGQFFRIFSNCQSQGILTDLGHSVAAAVGLHHNAQALLGQEAQVGR